MTRKITVIQFLVLILIVLFGLLKPSDNYERSTAAYQINLPARTAQPISDSEQLLILPSADKAIVHALQVNLAQEFLFFLGFAFSLLLLYKAYPFVKPLFTLSYFDNTFCHHIAINAP